jgi:tetratricopeptide (TPR) repeat protein
MALANLGHVYKFLGQVEKAKKYFENALIIFNEIESPYKNWVRESLTELERIENYKLELNEGKL